MATVPLEETARSRAVPFHRPRPRRGWGRLWLPLPILAAAGLWAAFAGRAPYAVPDPPPKPRAVPIKVSALGRLAPESEVIAVAPSSAADGSRIDRLFVAVGQRVAAGQVVAVLDTYPRRAAALRQAQAQVEVARAKLAQVQAGPKPEEVRAQEALIDRYQAELRAAERDLGRAATLLKKAAGSHQEFDDQNLKYEQARQALEQARAQLAAMKAIRPVDVQVAAAELAQAQAGLAVSRADRAAAEVRSPLAGRILRIHARPGERAGEQGIVDVGNTDVMHAVAEVYEEDVEKVQPGQSARVHVPTLGTDLTGAVVRKDLVVSRKVLFNNDPVADTDARVVEVHIRLAPPESPKVAGLSNARVEVVIDVNGEVAR